MLYWHGHRTIHLSVSAGRQNEDMLVCMAIVMVHENEKKTTFSSSAFVSHKAYDCVTGLEHFLCYNYS